MLIWSLGLLGSFLATVIQGYSTIDSICEIGLDPYNPNSVTAANVCISAATTSLTIYAAIYGLIAVPINVCLVQVFYYSWKELEHGGKSDQY
jgi:hypothetical protein